MSLTIAHQVLKRKRGESRSNKTLWKGRFDRCVLVVGVLVPMVNFGQVAKIWIEKDASGISLVSWTANLLISGVWLVYGLVHKEKCLIFANALWIVVNTMVVLGAVMYG